MACGWAPPAHGLRILIRSDPASPGGSLGCWGRGLRGACSEAADRGAHMALPSPGRSSTFVCPPPVLPVAPAKSCPQFRQERREPSSSGRPARSSRLQHRETQNLSAVTEMWPSFVILLLVWDCCYSQYYFVVFFNVLTTLCQQRWDVSSHSPHAHGLQQLQQPLPSGAPCVRACVEVLMSCSLLDHWF